MALKNTLAASFAFIALFIAVNSKTLGANAGCNLGQKKFEELKSIQDNPSFDSISDLRKELGIRKELLFAIIDCATQEATALRSNLNEAQINDQDMKKLQGRLADEFASIINYYNVQKTRIDDLGLQSSKDFSKNLTEWREGNYKPIAKSASNLIIWSRNQNIVQTAQNRIEQIGKTVGLLKLVDNDEIQSKWGEAQVSFKEALDYNQKAKDSLSGFGAPDESLGAIKTSLEALSKTYQKFFDISEIVSKTRGR